MPNNLTIMKEAANLVRNYMPNYGYVGTFGQAVRRLPFGNFIAWPIEVTRAGYNLIDIGIKEAKNPIFRELGLKKISFSRCYNRCSCSYNFRNYEKPLWILKRKTCSG